MTQSGLMSRSLANSVAIPGTRSELPTELPAELPAERDRDAVANGWRATVLAVVLIRATVFVVGMLSLATAKPRQYDPAMSSGTPWVAFDSVNYLYILVHGYPPGPKIPGHIAFFPLLPLTARAFTPVCQLVFSPEMAPKAAMIIISNVCSIIGLLVMYAWARSVLTARIAFLSTILLAVYPGAVFFCGGLTEGPFMMFVAIAIYLLYRNQLFAAAAVSAVGTLCRPTGVSLSLVVVLWSFFQLRRHLPAGQLLLRIALLGVVSTAGAISYECYLWHQYHRYDAFKVAEDLWDPHVNPELMAKQAEAEAASAADHRAVAVAPVASPQPFGAEYGRTNAPRYSLNFYLSRALTTSGWDRFILLGMMILLIIAFFKPICLPRVLLLLPLTIFVISYVPNWGLRASSIFRYESAAIPIFVVLAGWLSRPSRRPLLFVFAGLSLSVQLYYAFLFSRGWWVG